MAASASCIFAAQRITTENRDSSRYVMQIEAVGRWSYFGILFIL